MLRLLQSVLCHIGEYAKWQYQPASEAQLKYIKDKLSNEEWQVLESRSFISKGDAGQIISAIKIRNLTKDDLLRMRKKAVEERDQKKQEQALYSSLKIRKLMDSKKPKYKFYAVKHPTDLVITNSWDIAQDVIQTLNQTGKPCRYKSFVSMAEAIEFLRN